MGGKKVLIISIVITAVILGGGVFLLSNSFSATQITASQNAKVEIPEKTYDWGEIKYEGELATKTFIIKNIGTESLKITNIKTSCTCTKAQIIIDGQTSPYFSMHATSGWVGEIPPGKEGQLLVIFDQRFHGPSGVGPITRLISIETNDSQNSQIEFSLTGNVVK